MFEGGRNLIDRTIVKQRRCLAPFDARRIHSSHIPQVSSIFAAAWVTLMKVLQLLLHLSGNQVILVPKLHRMWIRDSFQRWPSGSIPVGRQHWFPNHEDWHGFRLSLLQNAFHCRGPLQTLWSSWGQKQHNARVRNRSVEALLKLRKIGFTQREEWWLARRSGARSPEVKPERHNPNCNE